MKKSSRHSDIVGKFGEHMMCNWLSRSGFEVFNVDHTGLDIIAAAPSVDRRLGITVKSRTRYPGTETDEVIVFKKADREKLRKSCREFDCEPWIGVYVEMEARADLYLTSLSNYDSEYRRQDRITDTWRMGQQDKGRYEKDPLVWHVGVEFSTNRFAL